MFQFHKGSIKTISTTQGIVSESWFQFHKGSIKTGVYHPNVDRDPQFQFHKGPIRTRRVGGPIDSGGVGGAKIIKAIQKMSMLNNIFSAEVRQLLLDAKKY